MRQPVKQIAYKYCRPINFAKTEFPYASADTIVAL